MIKDVETDDTISNKILDLEEIQPSSSKLQSNNIYVFNLVPK